MKKDDFHQTYDPKTKESVDELLAICNETYAILLTETDFQYPFVSVARVEGEEPKLFNSYWLEYVQESLKRLYNIWLSLSDCIELYTTKEERDRLEHMYDLFSSASNYDFKRYNVIDDCFHEVPKYLPCELDFSEFNIPEEAHTDYPEEIDKDALASAKKLILLGFTERRERINEALDASKERIMINLRFSDITVDVNSDESFLNFSKMWRRNYYRKFVDIGCMNDDKLYIDSTIKFDKTTYDYLVFGDIYSLKACDDKSIVEYYSMYSEDNKTRYPDYCRLTVRSLDFQPILTLDVSDDSFNIYTYNPETNSSELIQYEKDSSFCYSGNDGEITIQDGSITVNDQVIATGLSDIIIGKIAKNILGRKEFKDKTNINKYDIYYISSIISDMNYFNTNLLCHTKYFDYKEDILSDEIISRFKEENKVKNKNQDYSTKK